MMWKQSSNSYYKYIIFSLYSKTKDKHYRESKDKRENLLNSEMKIIISIFCDFMHQILYSGFLVDQ